MKDHLSKLLPFLKKPYACPKESPGKPRRVSIKALPKGLDFPARSISKHAVGITAHLQRNGHETYIVGGCVRDLLLGRKPKDFDIGTVAWPKTVRSLIRYSRIIGRRFRLVHVPRDQEIYEIATFRREKNERDEEKGRDLGENYYGTSEQDAWRRDFTVNAIFYDPIAEELVDFVGGLKDIQKKVIRSIGDPVYRFREDPVRILRAIRFSSFPDFKLEKSLKEAIRQESHVLAQVPKPRVREEMLKMMKYRESTQNFSKAQELGALEVIHPDLNAHWKIYRNTKGDNFATRLFKALDKHHEFPDPVIGFGVQLYLILMGQAEAHKPIFLNYKELKEDEVLLRYCMDVLFLSNLERETIYSMFDMFSRIANPDHPANKNDKKRERLTQLRSFNRGVQFFELVTEAEGWDPALLEEWKKLVKPVAKRAHSGRREFGGGRGRGPGAGHRRGPNDKGSDFKRRPYPRKTESKSSSES